jgi:uncharacterized membrane protein (DUF2068 family)
MKTSNGKLLRVIAIFKFLKATMLIVLGVGALRLLHKDVGDVVEGWAEALGIDPDGRFVSVALAKAAHLRPDQIRNLGVGSFVYATLFLVEGTGLWLQQRWGEWFTVILTGSFVPLEIYEIWRRPGAVKVAVLGINLGIAAYLIYRIRSRSVESGG